ncbi:MAG: hypothetical protein CXT70_02345 [Methanobacteriota archaeon]|nr:MAG: hypothetical protein CXT70_02345 [Euryarchaeota archaeon]
MKELLSHHVLLQQETHEVFHNPNVIAPNHLLKLVHFGLDFQHKLGEADGVQYIPQQFDRVFIAFGEYLEFEH